MNRHELLRPWLSKTLIDFPEILNTSKTAIELYSALCDRWLEDCQYEMKRMALEIKEKGPRNDYA